MDNVQVNENNANSISEKQLTLELPKNDEGESSILLKNNSVILIGANGSGKTRLGFWIEEQNKTGTHRIIAQKSLRVSDNIKLMNYEESMQKLVYGKGNDKLKLRGGITPQQTYQNIFEEDFDIALSALIALNNKQLALFHENYVNAKKDKKNELDTEIVSGKLERIWSSVLPNRIMKIENSRVVAKTLDGSSSYLGNEMSDGERAVLYHIAQILTLPNSIKTIIIDEPELHLHTSIMTKLWTILEQERQDCLFVYITHDTQFAANHSQSNKVWIKGYDGFKWEWEEVINDVTSEEDINNFLPQKLLLDILGSRKSVLFVEGKSNSYDTKLYRKIYTDYYVVPCDGCYNVIRNTKAMKENNLVDFGCYGIIDRDYRTDNEIEAFKRDNIYTLKVAEVENLFIVPEVLKLVKETNTSAESNSDILAIKEIKKKFSKELDTQISNAIVSELKYQLSLSAALIGKNNINEFIDEIKGKIDVDAIKESKTNKFNEIKNSDDYLRILEVFNQKNLILSVGNSFNINSKKYPNTVLNLFDCGKGDDLINALKKYVPEITKDNTL